MDDNVDSLLIDVRADTQGFARDIAEMRSTLDGKLIDGFSRAGTVLESGLVSAVRRGSLSFADLKQVALGTINEIAAQAVQTLFSGTSGGSGLSGLLNLGSLTGSLLGLPGRATGGPVSPGRGYIVGERGPELLVPTSAGRVEALDAGGPGNSAGRGGRDVRVAISVVSPQGSSAPQSLQRSSRQVASAVRRALREY